MKTILALLRLLLLGGCIIPPVGPSRHWHVWPPPAAADQAPLSSGYLTR